MPNPNNCPACDHKCNNPDPDWCYMFEREPEWVCMQHTARTRGGEELNLFLAETGKRVAQWKAEKHPMRYAR